MKLTTALIGALVIIILGIGVTLYNFGCPRDIPQPETVVMHDTLTLERYNLRIDTLQNNILKKIFQNQEVPVYIYQEKIKEIEKYRDYDLILGMEKKGTTLRLFALNQNDSLIKEEIFENVFSNFTAWSANDKIIVKSNKFHWSGVNLGYEHSRPINDLQNINNTVGNKVDIMKGVTYIERYNISVGTEYDIETKDIKLKLKTSVKLF